MINKIGKSKFIIFIVCVIIIIFGLVMIKYFKTDSNEYKISYRIYDKRNGWSKWYKNGETSGDGENAIQNIEIRIKSKDGNVECEMYSNAKWTSTSNEKTKFKDVYGLRMHITSKLYKDYNIFYRTFNKNDKWLEWAYNNEISGNIDKPITKVQIRVLKKDTSLEDYLKDYYLNEKKSKGFKE